jgi:hypothetical protein
MSVRLQSADEFYIICGCTVDPLNGACIEMDVVRTYWEGCVVPGRATAAPDQIDREQIECRPKIVDAVPQDRSPFFWNGNIQPEAVNYVRGGRFVLGNDAIRMELKGIDGRFEVRKMFFGPVDFYSAPIRGLVMSKSDPTKAPEFQRVLGNLLKKPPKPHSEMKIGKRPKAKPAHKKSKPQNG